MTCSRSHRQQTIFFFSKPRALVILFVKQLKLQHPNMKMNKMQAAMACFRSSEKDLGACRTEISSHCHLFALGQAFVYLIVQVFPTDCVAIILLKEQHPSPHTIHHPPTLQIPSSTSMARLPSGDSPTHITLSRVATGNVSDLLLEEGEGGPNHVRHLIELGAP